MGKDIDFSNLKQQDKEAVRKACVFTNFAYSLVEVADSLINDVNSILNPLGAGVNKEEMRKFKNTKAQGLRFRFWLKDTAKQLYKLDTAIETLEDSDQLYDIIMLIIDRCGGKMDILAHIRAMIFNSFKSQYKYYDKR